MPEREWAGLLSRGCGDKPHGGSIPSLFAVKEVITVEHRFQR